MIYAIVGYAIIILMMFMILKKKATPAFCFSILPVVGALICGFSFPEILEFINKGMGSVWKTAILFIFSVCYFSIMNDAGLFEPLVKGLDKNGRKQHYPDHDRNQLDRSGSCIWMVHVRQRI